MKKILMVITVLVLSIFSLPSIAENAIIPSKEIEFAKTYFKILYKYDVKAIEFAKGSKEINKNNELARFYLSQIDFIETTNKELSKISPPENYKESYNNIKKGIKYQKDYLINMSQEIESGSTFDIAFAINNWGFVNAQNHLQNGIEQFKTILNTYSDNHQLIIISATEVTEKELIENAQDFEYIKSLQDVIK